MNDAVKKFIMMVSAFFPRQKFAGEEAKESLWLRVMETSIGGYSDAVLALAAEEIIKTRDPKADGTMFPKPSECISACDAAKKILEIRAMPLLPPTEKANEWSDDRMKLAFDLVNNEMGRRAAREGWLANLYHFIRRNMRLPQQHEVAGIVTERREVDRLINELMNKERPTSVDAALIGLARTLIQRREELHEGVVNGVIEKNSWFMKG